jgi:hypothetical protein
MCNDTNQLDLFRPRPPAQRHSETSKAAALSIEPAAGSMRRRVLDFLRAAGPHGATDEQIQEVLSMAQNTERPRRIELVTGGFVFDSNRRRPTASGRNAVIWVASVDWIKEGAAD